MGRSTRSALDQMRARHALSQAGLRNDLDLDRASSVTNEVWLTDSYAIRVNRQPTQRLRREATVAEALPPESRYPAIVAHGGETGADWLITQRAEGSVLGRWWPEMADDQRRKAIRQLAECLKAIHATEPPEGLDSAPSPQAVSNATFSPVLPMIHLAEDLKAEKWIDRLLLERVLDLVPETADALEPWDTSGLIHGDVHFENIIWDGERITAILDFEYSRPGPPDLDLDILLRCCAYPGMHVAPDYEDTVHTAHFAAVPGWLAEDYPEIFANSRLLDRVRLYAIGFDLRDLRSHPPVGPFAKVPTQHPIRRLERTLDHESYVDALLAPVVG